MTRKRLSPEVRKDQILDAAIEQSKLHGYANTTRDHIAQAAGCSTGLVSECFGTMKNLRRDIVRAAIRRPELVILGQALSCGDRHAKGAPDDLKKKAWSALQTAV